MQPVERLTPDDMMSLVSDVGPCPMHVGAVLRFAPGPLLDTARLTQVIGERIRAVPRMRQRLVRTRIGTGRPYWVDATDFAVADHVETVVCPAPGTERELLRLATEAAGRDLPAHRPLWRALIVTGLEGDRQALVVVFHHVLADGIGGLAVLASLVDGTGAPPAGRAFPQPAPSTADLVRDIARARLADVRHLGESLHRVRAAASQLRPAAGVRPERCSLNRPTGRRRRAVVARADLTAVMATAHSRGVTLNDVVLAAVTAALGTLLRSRGEGVGQLVVSIPVSARVQTSGAQLGNAVGAVPVPLPMTGAPEDRIARIGEATRAAKQTERGASTALLSPAFRLLARLHLLRRLIDRQHVVHTFVTNLRGPGEQLRLLGAPIEDVVALPLVTGNVTVAFAVLSYAGALEVTVLADADGCPDIDFLGDAVQHELDALTASPSP